MVNKTNLQKNLQKKLQQRRNQELVDDSKLVIEKSQVKKSSKDEKPINVEKKSVDQPPTMQAEKHSKQRKNPTFTQDIQQKIQSSLTTPAEQIKTVPEEQTKPAVMAAIPKKTSVKPDRVKSKKLKIRKKIQFQQLSKYVPILFWYGIAVLIVLFDQVTKKLASVELIDNTVVLTSWLQFQLVHNPGAAFSMFADMGGWQRPFLVFISAAVSVFLVIWLAKLPSMQKLLPLALTLVLGGAVGNLVDRAMFGYVVDFISVHYQQLFFPSFNIADSAITIGAVLLFIDMIRDVLHQRKLRKQLIAPSFEPSSEESLANKNHDKKTTTAS